MSMISNSMVYLTNIIITNKEIVQESSDLRLDDTDYLSSIVKHVIVHRGN